MQKVADIDAIHYFYRVSAIKKAQSADALRTTANVGSHNRNVLRK